MSTVKPLFRPTEPESVTVRVQPSASVAGFVHDINNLLGVVGTYHTLLSESPLAAQQLADLKSGAEALHSAASLCQQLLAVSRGDVPRAAPLDVNRLVESTAEMLRPLLGDDIALSVEVADEPLRVVAADGQLERVLVNLALNARDAMRRGALRIGLQRAPSEADGGPHSAAAPPGPGYAVLSVKDAGSGMDSQTLRRVFEPFFSAKARAGSSGSGLGLYTVKEIVNQLGGRIDVETTLGEGSEFRVFLPLAAAPGAPRAAERRAREGIGREAAPGNAEPQPRLTALIVDDHDGFRASMVRMLGECDMTVLCAKDSAGALEILEQQRVDLLIADQVLPGMDGVQLLELARALRPRCARVLLTGYASPDVVLAAVNRAAVSKVLLKTMHPVAIRDEIERAALQAHRQTARR